MYSHVACDVMEERTLYLLKPSSLIWHLMPYLFLFHHAGTSCSQIDYILSSDLDLLQNYQIGGRDSENSSSHVKK